MNGCPIRATDLALRCRDHADEIAKGPGRSVLAELDDMLEGRALIPFWRTRAREILPASNEGVGINLRKLLSNPGDLNVALMIQGSAFAPFMERGKLVSMEAWGRFTALTRSDGLLMAMILN